MNLFGLFVAERYSEKLAGRPEVRGKGKLTKTDKLAVAVMAAIWCAASTAYAHGERPGHIDEGPGAPEWITIIMVVSWIIIALGVVLLVFRLIRTGGPKRQGQDNQKKI